MNYHMGETRSWFIPSVRKETTVEVNQIINDIERTLKNRKHVSKNALAEISTLFSSVKGVF